MKKKLLFSAFFVLGAAFAGCSDDEKPVIPLLAAPVLAEDAVTQVSVAVTWDAVENAASYACTLDGAAGTIVTQPSVRFDGLEPGRSYTVEVKAVAGQEQYLDSECARITLTTLPATQLAAPVLSAGDATENSATVVWEAVPDAASYVYTVDGGEELTVTGLSAVVTGLESGMPATVRVKAVSGQVQFLDSEFAELTVAAALEQNPFTLSVAQAGMNSISGSRISQKQDANLLLRLCPEVRACRQITLRRREFNRVGAPQAQRFGPDRGRQLRGVLAAQLVQGAPPLLIYG